MTKQEEIREAVKQYIKQNWLEDEERAENITKDIFAYLHSQDVVIAKYSIYSDLMEPLIKEE